MELTELWLTELMIEVTDFGLTEPKKAHWTCSIQNFVKRSLAEALLEGLTEPLGLELTELGLTELMIEVTDFGLTEPKEVHWT